jgi:ketosteroid isomerase-like protein
MPATETAPEDVKRAILAMDEEFVRNALAKDVDKLIAGFYAPDAQLFATHAPIATGHAAIKGILGGLVSAVQKLSLKTTKVETSGDLAYGTGIYEMTLSGADGKPVNDTGKYVVVYKRQADGQWRAVADIFNTSVPPA